MDVRREELIVKRNLETRDSVGVWRNLADPCPSDGSRFAQRSGPQRLLCLDGLARPDAEQRGGQEQRQTANGRVADHDGPERKRQGERRCHCDHPDHRGHQNHSCHHLTHPQRVSCNHGVAGACQDYVHALENLRRVAGRSWPGRRLAATCRKAGAVISHSFPEVAEECLSFVIPGQQAARGNRGEVN